MIINTRKKQLRILSSKKREVIKKNDKNSSYKLTKIITKIKELKKINYIASFISIKTEISTALLNNYLISLGKKICLPVILNDNKHLIFRSYNKQSILKKGRFDIPEPDENNKEILPELILTPCLAFDLFGFRLGYGGGYYDRTFARFKKINHTFISVVVAYDGQKINKVVRGEVDQKIDYILTEKKIYIPK